MYIEELEIDRFLQKVKDYEDMDDDAKWEAQEPVMSPTVQKYFELGELFLDDDSEEESEAADISSIAPDVFG